MKTSEKAVKVSKIQTKIESMKTNGEKVSNFDIVYNYYYGKVLSFVFNELGNKRSKDLSKDLTMEVMARVYEKLLLDKFKIMDDKTFNSWVMIMAKHHVGDYFRKLNGVRTLKVISGDNFSSVDSETEGDTFFGGMLGNGEMTQEEAMINEEKNTFLSKALSKINEKYRKVLEYSFVDELSYKEIGEKMGMTVSDVGVLISRAKNKLRSEINMKTI